MSSTLKERTPSIRLFFSYLALSSYQQITFKLFNGNLNRVVKFLQTANGSTSKCEKKKQRVRLKGLFITFSLDACLDQILTDLMVGIIFFTLSCKQQTNLLLVYRHNKLIRGCFIKVSAV